MRKVVENAAVAARAGELGALYKDGQRVTRLPDPPTPFDAKAAFAELERSLRALPVTDVAPVMLALIETRDAVLAAIAAALKPREYTMEHELDEKGRIVRTIVKEESSG